MLLQNIKCLDDLYFTESVCSYVFTIAIDVLTFTDSVIAKYSKY